MNNIAQLKTDYISTQRFCSCNGIEDKNFNQEVTIITPKLDSLKLALEKVINGNNNNNNDDILDTAKIVKDILLSSDISDKTKKYLFSKG